MPLNSDIHDVTGKTGMDYYTAMLLALIALALVMLFLLLHLKLYRTAFTFFLMQSQSRKVITLEEASKKQGVVKKCDSG
jgi:hypothetical protein